MANDAATRKELVELRASAGPPGALTALLWLIGSSGLFVLGYRYLPARRTQWREVVPAAALSLALWAPVTVVLTRYMQSAVSPTRFYGSLGAVVALLSWLYYFGLVFLFGAELSALRKRQA